MFNNGRYMRTPDSFIRRFNTTGPSGPLSELFLTLGLLSCCEDEGNMLLQNVSKQPNWTVSQPRR
jgi:hypothetical protein